MQSYGCDEFKLLKRVLMHRPREKALRMITAENHNRLLFDWVPDIDKFIEEHDQYRRLLESRGVEVHLVHDHVTCLAELLDRMPNLHYVHDSAVITRHGAILSRMAFDGMGWVGRKDEELVIKEALTNLGIPIFIDFDEPYDWFEGCLLLSPDTILVAHSERHTMSGIQRFISKALKKYKEILYVDMPGARRYMHPDTIYNRVDHHLAIAYPPAFEKTILHTRDKQEEIDFFRFIKDRGIEIIEVSDSEQRRLACTFVPLRPGVIFHYDTALDDSTQSKLVNRGVELILFHPDALIAGGGSLRCITQRLWRA